MRKTEKLLLTACGYTVLILALFYVFVGFSKGFKTPAISASQFLLILLFGVAISAAELMYNALKLNKVWRCLIHYSLLLVVFIVVFILSGNIIPGKSGAIFVAIVVYTMLYFATWMITQLIKKTVNIVDNKIDSKQKNNPQPNKKKPYQQLYRDHK